MLPAVIRRFHKAKEQGREQIVLWGTGSPMREFLHVDDLARAVLLLLERYDDDRTVNIGTGVEVTIRELAETVGRCGRLPGELIWDITKPDGTCRR